MAFTHLAKDRPRLLIVGGGYLGFNLARHLQTRIQQSGGVVTIVDPNPYMTYLPFLPEVAAGNIDARSVVAPFRQHLKDCEIVSGRVQSIDHANRKVRVQGIDQGPEFDLAYDDVVISGGSITRTFPIPGLAENGIGVKSIEEAEALRNWVLERIEVASLTDDELVEAAGNLDIGATTVAEIREELAKKTTQGLRELHAQGAI